MDGVPAERDHEELVQLAAIEALGALDGSDRARLSLHLRGGCARCLEELRGGRTVAAALAALVTPLPAPPPLRMRLLDSIGGMEADVSRLPGPVLSTGPGGMARWPLLVALASAAAATALVVGGLRVSGALADERALRHQAELAALRAETERDAALGERERLTALIETVGAPAARAVVLAGAEGVPSARGRAFVEPVGQRIVLLVYDLPPPPPGRTYQLWTIEAGKPASAGIFATSAAGSARHAIATVDKLGDALVLAVTVEPAGGVPQPTGPIVMAQTQ